MKSMDQFRRHETSAREVISGPSGMPVSGGAGNGRSGTPSRFDASFYRSHDALGYIPSDVASVRSQATYSSGLPLFTATGAFPSSAASSRGGPRTRSYASSIISQQDAPSTVLDDMSSIAGSMSYNQSDRVHRRRPSFGSSIAGSTGGEFDYKSQVGLGDDVGNDLLDDVKSQFSTTAPSVSEKSGGAGVTVF